MERTPGTPRATKKSVRLDASRTLLECAGLCGCHRGREFSAARRREEPITVRTVGCGAPVPVGEPEGESGRYPGAVTASHAEESGATTPGQSGNQQRDADGTGHTRHRIPALRIPALRISVPVKRYRYAVRSRTGPGHAPAPAPIPARNASFRAPRGPNAQAFKALGRPRRPDTPPSHQGTFRRSGVQAFRRFRRPGTGGRPRHGRGRRPRPRPPCPCSAHPGSSPSSPRDR